MLTRFGAGLDATLNGLRRSRSADAKCWSPEDGMDLHESTIDSVASLTPYTPIRESSLPRRLASEYRASPVVGIECAAMQSISRTPRWASEDPKEHVRGQSTSSERIRRGQAPRLGSKVRATGLGLDAAGLGLIRQREVLRGWTVASCGWPRPTRDRSRLQPI